MYMCIVAKESQYERLSGLFSANSYLNCIKLVGALVTFIAFRSGHKINDVEVGQKVKKTLICKCLTRLAYM